jgi:hypothetical protein
MRKGRNQEILLEFCQMVNHYQFQLLSDDSIFTFFFHSNKKQVIGLMASTEWSNFIVNHQELAQAVISTITQNL